MFGTGRHPRVMARLRDLAMYETRALGRVFFIMLLSSYHMAYLLTALHLYRTNRDPPILYTLSSNASLPTYYHRLVPRTRLYGPHCDHGRPRRPCGRDFLVASSHRRRQHADRRRRHAQLPHCEYPRPWLGPTLSPLCMAVSQRAPCTRWRELRK